MKIVIEGPDATGKSTLAQYISERTDFKIVESEGPPRYLGDIAERIKRRADMDDVIFVRHPVISHPIYDEARGSHRSDRELVTRRDSQNFYASSPILIYCRPSRALDHILKDYDTSEHTRMLMRQGPLIEALYRQWAMRHVQLLYEVGDDKERIVQYISAFDPVQDVEDFHVKNLINYVGKPRALEFELEQFRLKFMREETNEYELHMEAALNELDKLTRAPAFATRDLAFDNANFVYELAQSLDALADLVYVALGTAHLHGFDFRAAWRRVHAANMKKVRAEGNARTFEERIKLKMIKPPGWEPPKHDDLVEDHAHPRKYQP